MIRTCLRHTIILLSAVVFFSCADERKTISFKTGTKNSLLEKTSAQFVIDTIDRTLIVVLNIANPSGIPFPADKESGEKCTNAAFHFTLFKNGAPVNCNSGKCGFELNSLGSVIRTADQGKLSFVSDTVDLTGLNRITFRLPLYFLSALPAGTNNIDLEVRSGEYFSKPLTVKSDTVLVTKRKNMPGEELNALLSFTINIPKIYSSLFICNKISLQNDSTWNPYTSDFTIFRSSLPDIYYEIYNPHLFPFYRSNFQKSSIEFNCGDTCTFYFYSENDSISIGIYDHDNFSKDDVLGYIRCSPADIKNRRLLKSSHVASFEATLLNVKPEN